LILATLIKKKDSMNKRVLLNLILVVGLIVDIQAQDTQNLVEVLGQVVDAESKASVKARIYYESLPYGNKVGVFNNTSFGFKMEEGVSYSVSVKAEGYISATKTFSPEMVVNGVINDTIFLAPTLVGKAVRLESLIFARSKFNIPSTAYPELDEYVKLMKENPTMLIQLEGHTDYRGDKELNMELSENRVNVTKEYFVKKGIDKKRIKTVAYGGSKPVMRSNDPESRRLNRRVELRVTQF